MRGAGRELRSTLSQGVCCMRQLVVVASLLAAVAASRTVAAQESAGLNGPDGKRDVGGWSAWNRGRRRAGRQRRLRGEGRECLSAQFRRVAAVPGW